MRNWKYATIIGILILLPVWIVGFGQGRKPADWLTDGGNPQRTAWQQDETKLSTASVKNMKLLWKIKLVNEPRQMHSLLPVLIAGRVETGKGPKQIVIVTGLS